MQTPGPFEYERATSVQGAIASLERVGPGARVIAGGHSLLPMMKLRLANPEYLVDINDIAEMAYISEHGDELRIGAMTRHADLEHSETLSRLFPVFRDAEQVIADPVVRNRGTIGGALCQADPSEDLSAVCAAVGARMVIRGLDGERVVEMDEFHRGPYQTCVAGDEILIEIRVPAPARTGSAYEKVDRRAGDWAVVAAGASLTLDAGGVVTDAGIGLAAVGAGVSCPRAQASLLGGPPTAETIRSAAAVAAEHEAAPVTDQRGSAEYKRHVAGVLVTRALTRAAARAGGSGG